MLNRKTIERALAQYADHRDADVARRLALYGPMLLAAADVKKKAVVSAELPEGKDLAKYLLAPTAPILSTGALTLDRASMEAGVKEVLAALVEGLKPEVDVLQLINGLDWSAYLTDEMLKLASTDPVAWLERSREAAAGLGEAHEALVDRRERAHARGEVPARPGEQLAAGIGEPDAPLAGAAHDAREVQVGKRRQREVVDVVERPLRKRDVAPQLQIVPNVRHPSTALLA